MVEPRFKSNVVDFRIHTLNHYSLLTFTYVYFPPDFRQIVSCSKPCIKEHKKVKSYKVALHASISSSVSPTLLGSFLRIKLLNVCKSLQTVPDI